MRYLKFIAFSLFQVQLNGKDPIYPKTSTALNISFVITMFLLSILLLSAAITKIQLNLRFIIFTIGVVIFSIIYYFLVKKEYLDKWHLIFSNSVMNTRKNRRIAITVFTCFFVASVAACMLVGYFRSAL